MDESEGVEPSVRIEDPGMKELKKVFAFISFLGSLAVMILGIKLIGGSQIVGGAYSYWDPTRLEVGIFVTIIGTLAVVWTARILASILKEQKT